MQRTMMATAILVIAASCQSESDRVADLATRHATQQNELSRETVELQTELIAGTQQLVEADAQARRDFIELEGKLDEQRAEITRRQDDLLEECRSLANQRNRDPVIANAILGIGSLLACLLPLLVAGYLLRSHFSESNDHDATEILLDELTASHPELTAPAGLNATLYIIGTEGRDIANVMLIGGGGSDGGSDGGMDLTVPTVIYGGAGNDNLTGGAGNDILIGGT